MVDTDKGVSTDSLISRYPGHPPGRNHALQTPPPLVLRAATTTKNMIMSNNKRWQRVILRGVYININSNNKNKNNNTQLIPNATCGTNLVAGIV
jgi:hypothetical protein